ncbi:hypothetical protein CgunFtcFv8_027197 [Champsocephalus gunnari]|uniref:Uncharacterized protein n=1 Tax=Champsocephalus gunnari TaxID=52237 RepID=A0AAN8HVZ3_CHAGU|nr:hypothetical protein CgunFtcFv8_027197 [Champsocephalus gunnari]
MDRTNARPEVGELLLTCKPVRGPHSVPRPQSLHEGASLALGGSNWLDRVSGGLATLLPQQACLSPSLSLCSARQDRSQLFCCHVPFKACEEAGDGSSCCPRGAGGIQGPWSLVGTSVLRQAWVLDSWETSITPHPFIPPSIPSPSLPRRILYAQTPGLSRNTKKDSVP